MKLTHWYELRIWGRKLRNIISKIKKVVKTLIEISYFTMPLFIPQMDLNFGCFHSKFIK